MRYIFRGHRIEKFEQEFIMSDYIDQIYKVKADNSMLRDDPNTDPAELPVIQSKINIAKLILNAVYGFTITNVSKQSELSVERLDSRLLRKRVSSLLFKSLIQVGNHVVINKHKGKVEFGYPLMIGSAILYESKNMMSNVVYGIYDYVKSKGFKFEPLMTNTDSYFYNVISFKNEFENYEDFTSRYNKNIVPLFDPTGFKEENRIESTEATLAMLTNEVKPGVEITEFNGICSKVYSFKTNEDKEEVKGEGVNKDAKKRLLNHNLYGRIVDGTYFNTEDDIVQCDSSLVSKENNVNPFKNQFTSGRMNSGKLKMNNTTISKPMITLADIKSNYEDGINYKIYR